MNSYFVLAVLFAVTYTSSAYMMQSRPSTHKGILFDSKNIIKSKWCHVLNSKKPADFPNQCYIGDDNGGKGYTVGEHTPIGNCEKINCNSDFSYEVYG